MLQAAIACHRSGNLDQADAIYAQLVAHDPSNAKAIHLRGVVAYQKGKYAAAVGEIERALSLSHGNAVYLSDLGLARRALGRLEQAAAAFQVVRNPAAGSAPPVDVAPTNRWKCVEPPLRQPIRSLSIDQWESIEPPRPAPAPKAGRGVVGDPPLPPSVWPCSVDCTPHAPGGK
jgi:tetratricopeptide (TPR) repeat protein